LGLSPFQIALFAPVMALALVAAGRRRLQADHLWDARWR